jgi:hypothetical protein
MHQWQASAKEQIIHLAKYLVEETNIFIRADNIEQIVQPNFQTYHITIGHHLMYVILKLLTRFFRHCNCKN